MSKTSFQYFTRKHLHLLRLHDLVAGAISTSSPRYHNNYGACQQHPRHGAYERFSHEALGDSARLEAPGVGTLGIERACTNKAGTKRVRSIPLLPLPLHENRQYC